MFFAKVMYDYIEYLRINSLLTLILLLGLQNKIIKINDIEHLFQLMRRQVKNFLFPNNKVPSKKVIKIQKVTVKN